MTFACLIVIGCGDPPLHPITGNITLDGRPYERLIVYMDPMEGDVTTFNKGVGETDVTGKLIMNSSASTAESQGLATGKYRVYFNCWMQKGKAVGLSDEKADDSNRKLETEDIVPEPYNNPLESPVVFEVKAGDNVFDYNIPKS
jgi:hypothetical protein